MAIKGSSHLKWQVNRRFPYLELLYLVIWENRNRLTEKRLQFLFINLMISQQTQFLNL
jgi:hypothetical protein